MPNLATNGSRRILFSIEIFVSCTNYFKPHIGGTGCTNSAKGMSIVKCELFVCKY